ncbi:unnamed protein product [Linum tenue]|uniref:Uncharacterized protein n=1 Tax=Linum tenue TaxID=586396 RepID=A0AAV0HTJ7_9ROSI|nr:unnamed protein product [Linum tenue]
MQINRGRNSKIKSNLSKHHRTVSRRMWNHLLRKSMEATLSFRKHISSGDALGISTGSLWMLRLAFVGQG